MRLDKPRPLTDGFGRKIGVEVAERQSIPKELSKFISCKEVIEYLDMGRPINQAILEKRKNYFIVTKKGILYTPLKDFIKKCGYVLKEEKWKDASNVRGQAAYSGVVMGRVKIITNKDMFNKFQEGDILVTSMTTPDFISIMKKAGGFVTDEGGITCHAAIVAREMQKPCIIGTKIATKVLKDGDLVEVDANKGVVKIIKKS